MTRVPLETESRDFLLYIAHPYDNEITIVMSSLLVLQTRSRMRLLLMHGLLLFVVFEKLCFLNPTI